MGWLDAIFAPRTQQPISGNTRFELDEAYRSGDQARIAAAKQRAQAEEMQTNGGIASLTTDRVMPVPAQQQVDIYADNTDPNAPKTLEEAQRRASANVAKRNAQHEATVGKYPDNYADWTFADKFRFFLSADDPEIYDRARAAETGSQKGEQPPAVQGGKNDPLVKKKWEEYQRQKSGAPPTDARLDPDRTIRDNTPIHEDYPDTMTGKDTPTPVDPRQQMIDDVKRQRELIDAIYPQRQYDDSRQNAADQYALDARQRAAQMAQLAFFAGITQAAGGQWTAVGQGLMAAGGAYDQGFQRYQQALQDSANRTKETSDTQYKDNVARSDAAVKLYSDKLSRDQANVKLAQEEREKRRAELMKRFELEKPKISENSLNPEQDRADYEAWRRRMNASLDAGSYISGTFDATK